jgi:xylulokinase
MNSIISIGGGAKNAEWLQIQADIFNADVHKLASEQGPGLGAAMLAAVGADWYPTLRECSQAFTKIVETYTPIEENVKKYKDLYTLYKQVYQHTKSLNEGLKSFRE